MATADQLPIAGSADQQVVVGPVLVASETAGSPAAEQAGYRQAELLVAGNSVEQGAAENSVAELVARLGAIHQRPFAAGRWGNWLPQMEHSVKAQFAAVERTTDMRV